MRDVSCPRCGDGMPGEFEMSVCLTCRAEIEDLNDPEDSPEDLYGISMDMLAGDAAGR